MYFKLAIIFVTAQLCSSIPALSRCDCSRQYTPICGSDGVTYGNQCLLQCAQTTSFKPIYSNYPGRCHDIPQTGDCGCSLEYIPVCGTDGSTYPNICHLNCASSTNPSLGVAYNGVCEQNDCFCAAIYQPVCGTNGKTYSSDCQLNCATAHDSSLGIAYRSPCVKKL